MRTLISLFAATTLLGASWATAQTLTLEGPDHQSRTLTVTDLAAMPHVGAALTGEDGKAVSYEGVPLTTLLQSIGAPAGKALHGRELADVVIMTATDGYRVALSLAETDPAVHGETMVIADRAHGAPLDAHEGPFRLVIEGDRRPARSVRMVADIRVTRLSPP